MKHLLIDLALDGFKIVITDGGFAMKDTVEVRMTKGFDGDKERHEVRILSYRDFDHLEDHIKEMRDSLNHFLKDQALTIP